MSSDCSLCDGLVTSGPVKAQRRQRTREGKGTKCPDKCKATATAKGSSRTPDDKPICFRYNAKACCEGKDKSHFALSDSYASLHTQPTRAKGAA